MDFSPILKGMQDPYINLYGYTPQPQSKPNLILLEGTS